jgi:hypothetical protein
VVDDEFLVLIKTNEVKVKVFNAIFFQEVLLQKVTEVELLVVVDVSRRGSLVADVI